VARINEPLSMFNQSLNPMDEKYEMWLELFDELSTDEKRQLLNKYYKEHSSTEDDVIYPFNSDGLEMLGCSTMDALDIIIKTYKGDVTLTDEYIRFNRSAQFESLSRLEVESEAQTYANNIFSEVDWTDFIDEFNLESEDD
jgi:hypothetical protein